jgi:tRNA G10  N-methylase Trm11
MEYFFILGSNSAISLAEIMAFFNEHEDVPTPDDFILSDKLEALIFKTNKNIDSPGLIKNLGGSVKIGIIKSIVGRRESNIGIQPQILDAAFDMINEKKISAGKFNFGISIYGDDKLNTKHIGLTLKNRLKEEGISSRWVVSREKNLSSVVVDTNKLTGKGMEIIIIRSKNKLYIGHTMAVQPFRELSYRDYGRPSRDDRSGMLPPKLAQIMINLSGAKSEDTILDPFCGSGTILTEAMLMGYQNLIGSDISQKATEDSMNNINWVKNNILKFDKLKIENLKLKITTSDILTLDRIIKKGTINAIVTEPFLGPQRGKHDLYKTKQELEKLYEKAILEFDKLLKPGGRVVMIWPVFMNSGNKIMLDINIPHGIKNDIPLPSAVLNNIISDKIHNKEISIRNTLIYGRNDQKIWREIVLLTKE